ncbi:hypothetical protein EP47_06030 [Legionella norrlandica]|uniref:MFS transporter n=1 Tax=Legionella norrlandica TaxID=1498499 RepID=A0A0A2SSQ5_9GAMM|nr:hypothetical protein [Legionella norrlandica]KGP63777.1 hypothetical protein EP47_06030 [Legionella norrlandica]
MEVWFRKLIPSTLLGDKELQRNFFLALLLSAMPAAFSIGTTVFNYSIFLSTYPSAWIPYWMFGDGVTLFLLGNVFSLFTPKNFKKYIQTNFFIIGIILMFILLLIRTNWYWGPFVSILILRACSSILGAIVWSFISTLFYYRQFKAIFNRFTVAATLASIGAPLLYATLTSFMQVSLLPLLFLIFLAIGFLLTSFTVRVISPETEEQGKKKVISSSPIRYPLFRTLIIVTILFNIIFQLAEFLFRKQLEINFDKEQIGTFVSFFLLTGNAILLGTQAIGAVIFSRIKFHFILQFVFLLVLILGTIYWITPTLWPAVILCSLGVIFPYGWLTMIFKSIVNVFPPTIIIKSEIFLKSYCGPISISISALFAILSAYSAATITYFPIIFIVLSIFGIFLSVKLFKRYSNTLKEIITSGCSFGLREEKEQEYMQNLVLTTLNKPTVGPLEIALITPKLFKTPPSLLYQILTDNTKREIQNVVIKVLDQYPSNILDSDKLIALYQNAELHPGARELLYKLLSNVHSEVLIEDAKARLKENPTTKNALLILLNNGAVPDYIVALNLTVNLAHSNNAKHRVIAAKVLHALGSGRFYDLKGNLLTDKDPLVRITAFHHLPAQDVLDMLPTLGKFLNRNTINILHQRFELKKLLSLAHELMKLYRKTPDEYRDSAQAFIVPLPDQSVEPFIIEFLNEKHTYLRTLMATQLLERKLKVTFTKKLCESLLDALHFEVNLIQQYYMLSTLESLWPIKPLLHNRIYYAKQRFLYWYASYHTNTINISASIAKINPYYVTRDNKNIQDKAIEFLITHENKLVIRKLIETAFDNTRA